MSTSSWVANRARQLLPLAAEVFYVFNHVGLVNEADDSRFEFFQAVACRILSATTVRKLDGSNAEKLLSI
jgi:hypothetical protein